MKDAGDYRLLAVAVLASIALHAVLLFALPWMERHRIQRVPLPGPVAARLAPPAPIPAPPAKAETPPAAKPVPRRPSPATTAPVPAAAPSVPVPSAEPARPPAESAPQAPAVAKAEPQSVSQPEFQLPSAAPSGTDPGALARFRLEIMDLAKRHKRYPRLAIDNGWEGRVEVRMVVAANGALASLSVKSGAGYEALDQEALAMLRKAASAATVPPALLGREFSLEVPVVFSLKEAGG